jgi:hypothetical protein
LVAGKIPTTPGAAVSACVGQQMQNKEKAYKSWWLADIVAPYVYACWQIRCKVRNEEVHSDERGADSSDAMA